MNKTVLWSFLLFFSGSETSRTTDQKNAEFAVDLYKAISLSHKNNVIFSPLGTTVLLGMVQLGAKGKAQQQILRTLRMQENSAGKHLAVTLYRFNHFSFWISGRSKDHRTSRSENKQRLY